MNEQLTAAIIAGLESMSIETRWLLRGIQLGIAFAGEVETSKREELIRCGLYEAEASLPGQNSGVNSPN